jgi:hypothetical protein
MNTIRLAKATGLSGFIAKPSPVLQFQKHPSRKFKFTHAEMTARLPPGQREVGTITIGSSWWCNWLRHCATSRKVAGSIPDGVTGHLHNPSGRSMALRSTQTLIKISFLEGKGGRGVGLTTLPSSYAGCLEIWEPQPPGTLRACTGIALLSPSL